MKRKNSVIGIMLIIALVLSAGACAFADAGGTATDDGQDEQYVLFQNSLNRLIEIVGSEKIEELRLVYETAFPEKSDAEAGFRSVITSINMQAMANDFTDEQIRAVFAGYIKTTEAAFTGTEMQWSETPRAAVHDRSYLFNESLENYNPQEP